MNTFNFNKMFYLMFYKVLVAVEELEKPETAAGMGSYAIIKNLQNSVMLFNSFDFYPIYPFYYTSQTSLLLQKLNEIHISLSKLKNICLWSLEYL